MTIRIRAMVAGATLVVGAGLLRAQEPPSPTFAARVDVVQLDVAVMRQGDVVRGLQASDFEVRDNGVRQAVSAVALDDVPVHVLLALDMSESVKGPALDRLRAAAAAAFDLLTPDDTAAVIGFSSRIALRTPFTADRARLDAALAVPLAAGDTALFDAVHTALVRADDRAGRPVVLVHSDGVDTGSFLTEAQVMDTARRTRAVVYAVTTQAAARGGFLTDLVRQTGGRRLDVGSDEDIAAMFAATFAASRLRYLISYVPEGVEGAGWHELSVRVPALPDAQVEARPGYLVVR